LRTEKEQKFAYDPFKIAKRGFKVYVYI